MPECVVCHKRKKPIGVKVLNQRITGRKKGELQRESHQLCTERCPGYAQEPMPSRLTPQASLLPR